MIKSTPTQTHICRTCQFRNAQRGAGGSCIYHEAGRTCPYKIASKSKFKEFTGKYPWE